jgi:hypothetical protein
MRLYPKGHAMILQCGPEVCGLAEDYDMSGSVNNLDLAVALAKKRAAKTQLRVEVWRNRRQARKYHIVVPSLGEKPPKSSNFIDAAEYTKQAA